MKRTLALAALGLLTSFDSAYGFCGFYVAKADTKLLNKASQVIMVRDGEKTAISMFSDYKGEPKDFALVVPVPVVLAKEQIAVGDKLLFERLDAFTAPRLVEYFDEDPCNPVNYEMDMAAPSAASEGAGIGALKRKSDDSYGVKVEARYTVGEYDIVLLSAKESGGLERWLVDSGYKMPKGVAKALKPYIKQDMKFFVAKVNLKEQAKSGFQYLRPLQFAFETKKYMLPIRLGIANADGPQDLVIYAITKKGRVESTNYRTVKIPSDKEIPTYVKDKFGDFYKAMFDTAHKKESERVVFTEYAWNMGWCDPCAADPLTREELRKVGVFWLGEPSPQGWNGGGAVEAYVTRLHVRYDAEHFPEDLAFQETSDTANFQGRYVMRHPFKGSLECAAGKEYAKQLVNRREEEAKMLASLTRWDINTIRKEMGPGPNVKPEDKKWFQNIFK